MVKTRISTIIELAVSAVLFAVGLIGFTAARAVIKHDGATKGRKKKTKLWLCLAVIAAWFFIGTIITALCRAKGGMNVEFQMFSERVDIFGITFAKTSVLMWGITALVLMLCLIFRFAVFPKFKADSPGKFQNIMELSVEAAENFTAGIVGKYSKTLAPYIYSLAVFMVFSAAAELFGLRAPTSDLIVTLSMGLITFAFINYYGIKQKGFGGRVKGLASPTPVIFPMKILSDVAVPISLACRLFGNMIGGMIVMDLLKSVLGGYASGVPAVAGLYFNLFHPLIQTYIFIILSLTFINEAIE